MPVIEYALDLEAQQRIQVHIPSKPGACTVMLNRSVLGFLATPEELLKGKHFVLPDHSDLYVRFERRRVQVFRNSVLLAPLTEEEKAFDASPAARAHTRKPGEWLRTQLKKLIS